MAKKALSDALSLDTKSLPIPELKPSNRLSDCLSLGLPMCDDDESFLVVRITSMHFQSSNYASKTIEAGLISKPLDYYTTSSVLRNFSELSKDKFKPISYEYSWQSVLKTIKVVILDKEATAISNKDWCFLFENLNRAVDELYHLCELECDLDQMKEDVLVLEEARSYFRKLRARVEGFENVKRSSSQPSVDEQSVNVKSDHRRPHALSWEASNHGISLERLPIGVYLTKVFPCTDSLPVTSLMEKSFWFSKLVSNSLSVFCVP
ncbi:hypothetical protein GIB67_012105 [Kingdonia uniflora]|uniref:S phase cyclin A-associated protein in the endoplasmic reticulum N-terminal domain-containing protein n=1 Tax=Kingdonia uniflora TaxID=39325 RepID=A0A7J7LHY1_9MAGN|nr:hypothetical protein GIB67_012105 [Kingdonia uniflora]